MSLFAVTDTTIYLGPMGFNWEGPGQVAWDTGLQLRVLCYRPVCASLWSQAQGILHPLSINTGWIIEALLPVSNWVTFCLIHLLTRHL